MPGPRVLTDALLPEAVSRKARSNAKVFVLISMLAALGCVVLGSQASGGMKHPAVLKLATGVSHWTRQPMQPARVWQSMHPARFRYPMQTARALPTAGSTTGQDNLKQMYNGKAIRPITLNGRATPCMSAPIRASAGDGAVPDGLSDGCKGAPVPEGVKLPIMADESVMAPKAHGTTDTPVQQDLRWNCDVKTADKICSFNRHFAEYAGYWESTDFLKEVDASTGEITFYDSVTGKPLFIAPRGRSFEDFVRESKSHGWPSFRDEEVVWDDMRVLKDGEAVSTAGTHLGHNLPDRKGNRYCINLVSVAGRPVQ